MESLEHMDMLHIEEEEAILEWLRKNRKQKEETGDGHP